MLTTSEIRSEFLNYFKNKGHEVVASSSLVPGNDATLLFTNAGMVQFKELFLGQEKRAYSTATTSQRCVRAGGKHNDLDNVGYTARHHTFFEMLGNFSFGDYFKHQAIAYAWAFLTETLKLPSDKLWVTVFEEDDEAYAIWRDQIGVPESRIARIGAKDNFWQMGDTGPCGPCSEIFYDHGPEVWGGPPGTPEEDGDRYIEIWNLVFMQYDRAADGTLTPLPKPSVDTGMGLERIAAVLQHVHSNYEIDLFQRLIQSAAAETGCQDLENASLKVIADHIRSCAFLITDGVAPSNEGRGYVLRRIIRRAARHGHKLGCEEPFFYRLVAPLVAEMGEAFPELRAAQNKVTDALLKEEQRFLVTLATGMKILEEAIEGLSGQEISGEVVFKLYDTYGFPSDLTADIARERELSLDMAGFDREMEAQRERARQASQFSAEVSQRISVDSATQFEGYTELCLSEASVVALFSADGAEVEQLLPGQSGIVVLAATPFYGESGGQVGDQGVLRTEGLQFDVQDTQKSGDTFLHHGVLRQGRLQVGQSLAAEVDAARRQSTVLNHSATHLLHEALRRVLGEHVEQKGSLVTPDSLRFDFSHEGGMSAAEMQQVEAWVNAAVRANAAAEVAEMSMDEAKAKGAAALFGEKYGDVVRVVGLGESIELCGGTHVARTGEIGLFKLISEGAVASGTRRVEAITGATAVQWVQEQAQTLQRLAEQLRAPVDTLEDKLQQLQERHRSLGKELQKAQDKLTSQAGGEFASGAVEMDGFKLLVQKVEGVDGKGLRQLMDQLKDKLGTSAVVLGAVEGEKVKLIAGVSKDLSKRLKAGDLVNHVAVQVGGRGGGRPDMAQAGGDNPAALADALASVEGWLRETLN